MHATPLRELYHVLGICSTATQQAICEDLLRKHKSKPEATKLAELFQQALKLQQSFDAGGASFVPATRTNQKGRNPVTTAMSKADSVDVMDGSKNLYSFHYMNREIPHLRTALPEEEACKAWIDCVGLSDAGRPVVCEIKWKSDKNAFYGFIQLLTYLSELATEAQMKRSQKEKLFGSWDGKTVKHDIVLMLVNADHRGAKVELGGRTHDLAKAFAKSLDAPAYAKAARVVGNIGCFSATVDEKSATFVDAARKEWLIER